MTNSSLVPDIKKGNSSFLIRIVAISLRSHNAICIRTSQQTGRDNRTKGVNEWRIAENLM